MVKVLNYRAILDMIVLGGCALNRDAMDRLRTEWKSVWYSSNPGDPRKLCRCCFGNEQETY